MNEPQFRLDEDPSDWHYVFTDMKNCYWGYAGEWVNEGILFRSGVIIADVNGLPIGQRKVIHRAFRFGYMGDRCIYATHDPSFYPDFRLKPIQHKGSWERWTVEKDPSYQPRKRWEDKGDK